MGAEEIDLMVLAPLFGCSVGQMDIPAKVGRNAQSEPEPPKQQHAAHPSLVAREAQLLGQQARTDGKDEVQGRDFRDSSEPGVDARQSVVRLAELRGYAGSDLRAKGRDHGQGDDRQVQKHDGRLAPGVLPKTSGAREPGAEKESASHRCFKQQNQVGAERGACSEESFAQSFASLVAARAGRTRQSFSAVDSVAVVVEDQFVWRVYEWGFCGHSSPQILGTPGAGAVFRRLSPPIFLEGGAGERVQGARAAYGTCFVCGDRPGRPVIPVGGCSLTYC